MILLQRKGNVLRLTVDQNAISIDPTPFNELHIIIDYEQVACRNNLKIPEVRKKVWLHEGQLQWASCRRRNGVDDSVSSAESTFDLAGVWAR